MIGQRKSRRNGPYKWFKLPQVVSLWVHPCEYPHMLYSFFLLINTLLVSLLSVFVEILFCKAKEPGPCLTARMWYSHCLDRSSICFKWLWVASTLDPSSQSSLPPVAMYVMVCAQSCLTLCNTLDCSPPGSSVHGILPTRILEWVAIASSKWTSLPRDQPCVSCIDRQIPYHCATWEDPHCESSFE